MLVVAADAVKVITVETLAEMAVYQALAVTAAVDIVIHKAAVLHFTTAVKML